jgi:O-antigen/teichoic acid export membrane protein
MIERNAQIGDGLSRKLVRNTFYNFLGRSWGTAVAIFMTPYIIRHIGVERFGIWAIVGIITGYFGLLDFGVGSSFVKYIAEFNTKREYQKINAVVNMGVIFYLIFAISIIIPAFIFIDRLLVLFKVPFHLYNEAKFVFLAGIIIFLASNAVSVFNAVLIGLQRMDTANKLSVLVSIPNILGTIFFLEKGYSLAGLMVNNAIVFIIGTAINIYVAFRILPELKFNLSIFNKDIFKKIFSFGFRMQLAKVSGMVSNHTDKIIIANLLSLSLVAMYQLGSSIIYYAMSVSSLLVSALMPAFSEIEAKGERGLLIQAYLRSTKYLSIIVIPLFIFLIVAAPRIIFVWMGSGYENAVLVVQILAIAWMLNAIAQSAGSLCMAINKPQLLGFASLLIIVLNIVFSIILIKSFGFYGAAWGAAIAVNAGGVFFLINIHRTL